MQSENERIARAWCRQEGCCFIKMQGDNNYFIYEWMDHSFRDSAINVKDRIKTA